jgi:hypothetical protein
MCFSDATKGSVSGVSEHIFDRPRVEEETASLAATISLTATGLVALYSSPRTTA